MISSGVASEPGNDSMMRYVFWFAQRKQARSTAFKLRAIISMSSSGRPGMSGVFFVSFGEVTKELSSVSSPAVNVAGSMIYVDCFLVGISFGSVVGDFMKV